MDWDFLVFFWFAFGIVGITLGIMSGKVVEGFPLGLFLGPIGWIIVFLLPGVQVTENRRPLEKNEGKARIAAAQFKHGRYVNWRKRREKEKAYYKQIRLVMRQAREAGLIEG